MAENGKRAGRPMRRRGRVPGGRPYRYNVRLTAADHAAFTAAAEAAGVTVPYLMAEHTRAGLRGGGRMSAVEMRWLAAEMDAIGRDLHRYGVNLNQIAAAANSGVVQGEAAVLAVLNLVARVAMRTERVLDVLDPERGTAE